MGEMTVAEFLAMLQARGIKFRVEGEKLRYRGPAAQLTPETHAAIAARKAELLALLQQQARSYDGPRPGPRELPLPLSFAQQRLWFLDQLQPGSAAYNIHDAIALSGPLDVAVLERSFTALIARHESLRTTFAQGSAATGNQPFQQIAAPIAQSIPLRDLQSLPPDEQWQQVRLAAQAEAQQPFDLQHGPLLRTVLLRLAPTEHVLLVTMHHIVSDGWSMGIFIRELSALYAAGGAADRLPPLPVQYADYALWQRERLSGAEQERLLDYWRQQFADAPTFLDLPTDRPRPATQSFAGAAVHATLDAALTRALKVLSQRAGATLFMTLLAAWQLLLARHSGQERVVVGTPIAGRTHKELEDLIGFFVNTLALHTDLRGNPTFLELLERVRALALDAFAHQDLPFEQLIDALHPARDLSRPALVQAMFAFQNAPTAALELPGLTLRPLPLGQPAAKVDLTLNVVEDSSELRLDLVYNSDLFTAATIERMMERFQILLRGIVADPSQRIGYVPLLTVAEQRQIVHDWNIRPLAPAPQGWIHEQIAEQAARTPDALAVTHGAEQISYAELDRRANQLAHYLRRQGIGPETVVGVCLERSIGLILALLGILKAGGTYLPLDPDYPTERLRFMLDDTRAPLLIAKQATQARLSHPAVQCLDLDADWPQIAEESPSAPPVAVAAEMLAYLIYTSGSTGRPKGVGVAHGTIARHMATMRQLYRFDRQERELLFMSPSFDVSIEQILLPLLSGACVIVRAAELWSPSDFTEVVRELELTIVNIPLIYFRAWLPALATATPPPRLRLVIVGGEELTADLVRDWQRTAFGQIRLFNAYGPTETTITATICDLLAIEYARPGSNTVPIGRLIGERTAYILDRYLQPLPVNVPGELYLGGSLLARGYINRPDLTAEKFIPDPFAQGTTGREGHSPGARLYKTGDLVRYRSDGQIEFLGRIDQQVKLRGFRIELGEIEAALKRSGLLRDVAVLLREDGGEKRLVAYLVKNKEPVALWAHKEQRSEEQRNNGTKNNGAKNNETTEQTEEPGSTLSSSPVPEAATAEATGAGSQEGEDHSSDLLAALRAHAAAALPEYMLPSAFVVLDEFPLTPNGKLDRNALPRPDAALREREPYAAPTTELERSLAEIWQAVLKVERIGIHANFFDLGGHSLLATQVVSRLRDTLQIEIPLRVLFETPTIAGMSQRIAALREESAHATLPPLQPVPRDGRLPLSFAQQRLWFLDQLQPGNPFYNIHTALEILGRLDRAAVERSLHALIARHEALRTSFPMIDDQPVQQIAAQVQISLPVVDLRDLPAAEREAEALRLAAEEAAQPFDLRRGPLLRVRLLWLEPERQILVLTIHHIVSDGWSMGVLVRELFNSYRAYAGQSAAPIETVPLPIQYADFAVWQRQWLQGTVLEQQLAYWKRQLADLPVLELPTDRPRPPVLSYRGATTSFVLPQELASALLRLGQQADATLFMTLLAGFQLVMARYSGQTDLAVGSPIANRTRRELEDLIGFFVNMLVLRTSLAGGPTTRELIGRVRDVCLSAYAHQDLPFEMLVEELQPERSLSYNPLFQIGFALQNTPMGPAELPGLELRPLQVVSRTSTFDLSLFMSETPDGLYGLLEYNTDLFDAATIQRLIRHFHTALAGMVADPDRSVMALPLLTEPELAQLAAWDGPTAAVPPRWVHEQFETQATRNPDRIALLCGDRQLSYGELNARANRLAHHLRSLSAGPEVRVGLCVDRSPELIIGLLGILKAGAAYVPLDPEYPRERLEWMLHDAELRLLVTRQALSDLLAAPTVEVVLIDGEYGAGPDENPGLALPPDTLAYVIYTSGSTGQPKGVLVEHQQLANTLFASQAAFAFEPADRMPSIASFSFDIALFELFCPLLAGGSVVLLSKQQILDLPGFAHTLESCTVLHTLPSLMRQISGWIREHGRADRYRSLRQIFVGGDAVAPDLLAEIRDAFPAARVNILYGPTEATIICATHPVQPGAIPNKHLIGRPMHNSTLRLYDDHRQRVPVGVPGELYIGGASVTRGYWRRDELTAEKFVTLDGQRWYRSGDKARLLADGTLEFLGRIDQQVKIRGFRIELGEIEAALNEHPEIRDALVIARADQTGDQRLVGYVVPAATSAASSAAQASYVDDWQLLYDETYAEEQPDDPAFHIVGWHSSYSGQPFPAAEMREWRDATVERIRGLQPQRILEIGCGTGLLLFPLAAESAAYHGIDFSAPALAHIRRHLPPEWSHVTLAQRRADELADLRPGSFDTVILNSVAQYFPSVEYLVAVISQAITLIAPGGHLFIGDVRSRPLLDAFATAVTLAQAAPGSSRQILNSQVRQLVAQERELLLDPGFFHALPQALPRISDVQVEIKRGHARNELSQFRYDVTLTLDMPPAQPSATKEYDWSARRWTLPELRAALQERSSERMLLRQIPSARVRPLVEAVASLRDPAGPATAAELRAALSHDDESLVEPEALWTLGEELGYEVRVGWSGDGADGCYDAVFSRSGDARLPQPELPPLQSWGVFATAPAAARATAELAPQLRAYLQARLPEHMIPSAFLVLGALPLTPNGKVDRAALPAPDWSHGASSDPQALPRNPVEAQLVEIWQQVLGLTALGIHDNFFALGGHSLLATQVISRIRSVFRLELPVRALFEHPTIAELGALVLSAQQAAGVAQMLPPLTRRASDGPVPLSFAQQRLWFIEQLQPGTGSYHVAAAWRVRGPLDSAALQASLDRVIARHESLRTSFAIVDEQPVQIIAPPHSLPIGQVDLSSLAAEEQRRELERQVRATTETPFDLRRGPLLRALLLRLDRETHALVLALHHIITDGWSMSVLIGEIVTTYVGLLREQPVELPALPVQYADYALWQRQWLQGEVLDQQLAYWRQQLRGVSPLQLPTDHPRPALPSMRGDALPVALDETLLAQLRELSQQSGATLFMTLLAAWQLLLHRYSGQDDIAVGTPIAGRTQPEIEPLIGFFVNTLVLRTRLSGEQSFRSLLEQVRTTTLDAYAHQDAPFEAVVEALQPERSTSRPPLFQVMFALSNSTQSGMELPEIRIEPLEMSGSSAKFDLTLSLFETATSVSGTLEYALDLFETATIERLLGHFQTLLRAIVVDPEQRIDRLPLLTDAEQQQIVHGWNATAAEFPEHLCVHELMAAQAERAPDAIALVFEDRQMSYAELDQRTNQLAHQLRQQGITADDRVGVCLPRSLELVIALLAVHKAGGAYVPLDPSYPAERLQWMLHDAACRVLITEEALLPPFPAFEGALLCVDRDRAAIDRQLISTPARIATPDHLAYVIYTSGSTGRPKGVQVAHRGLCNLAMVKSRAFGVKPGTRLLQFASSSFDASVSEIFIALAVGATLVLAPREALLPGPNLIELLRQQAINVVTLPPSALTAMNVEDLPALHSLVVAGEACPVPLAQRWRFHADGRRRGFFNGYGPTETTVCAAIYEWPADQDDLYTLPLGRPIANAQVYILDRQMQPVPIGVAGEIYIGGAGVAWGYRNRPELTAEKFIPDPFRAAPGSRLYRSGDLARFLPDGTIEYLGRIDQQLKLRGFRIEPGEIESALLQHPAVSDALVLLREDRPGDPRLVAYLVKNKEPVALWAHKEQKEQRNKEQRDQEPRTETRGALWARYPEPRTENREPGIEAARSPAESHVDLRAFLKERLPDYMLPSAFVVLDEWPLTPNGKIDRRVLPAPELSRAAAGQTYRAPRSAAELALAELWQSLLHVDRVGIDDNFFELGGHSLLAIRLVEQIRRRFGQSVPVAALFAEPTIAHLAQQLEQQPAEWSPLVPIQPQGSHPPLFCVHGLGGSVLNYAALGRALGPEQPFYGLQAPGLEADQSPHTTIDAMAAAYVQAIRARQPQGPYYLSGWSLGGVIAFEMARLLHQQGETVRLLALLDSLPAQESPSVERDEIEDLLRLAQHYGLAIPGAALRGQSFEVAAAALLEQAQRQDPQTWHAFDLEQFIRIARLGIAQLRALDQHQPGAYPGPAIIFTSRDNPSDPAEQRAAAQRSAWAAYAAEVEVVLTPGTHSTMLDEPNVQALASQLLQRLDAARAEIGELR
jgi:amino acid adenylation domain-containing protein